ncbi:TetR/AcrR family transcriptional regulator [Longispora albida]|uniref:TetR/AcrR family transcriptional regulator n=1 Tax=Longispora albida TaxID=203523 RepID=UPI00035E4269|nr:TetR/AcrR family transcriptional regulator [Longispora albida]
MPKQPAAPGAAPEPPTRRERERAGRHALIISTARELAEAEGWEAVTTRRLAERIEYSQPVLYSHFASKNEIAAAVAVEGFAELAAVLRARRTAADGERAAMTAVATAYLDFGRENPALYDAMFILRTDLPFGGPDAPAPLVEAFTELAAACAPWAGGAPAELFTETVWSALHGLVALERSGRLRPDLAGGRLTLLLARLTSDPERKPGAPGGRRR